MKTLSCLAVVALFLYASPSAAETERHYENRLGAMLGYATSINDYVSRRLEDRRLCAYAQAMAQTNAQAAEQMTPPPKYELLHPHFLLVLKNVERAFYYAADGKLQRFRHHQKLANQELQILEELARKAGLDPFFYRE